MHAFLLLAAQSESSVSIGIALTLGGMLVGGALVFGAMRENVSQLKTLVEKLSVKVDTLTEKVAELSGALHTMQAVDKAIEEITAKHPQPIPHRDPHRDPRRE